VSPLFRDRLLIGLAPNRVAVVQLKRGPRPSLGVHGVRGCDETTGAPWTAALDQLDYMLGKLPPKSSGTASITLSNQFVRYVNVPWTPGIFTAKDRQALAVDCFRAIHGEAADAWRVILDTPKYGHGNLAAAIDQTLLDRLHDILDDRHWRLVSLRPHLSAAFDIWRARLEPNDGCFAVVEPGCVTALYRRGNHWATVDNRRFHRSSASQAALTLKQSIDADRLQGGEGAVALWAPGLMAEAGGSADRPLRRLAGWAGPWPEDPWRALAWSAA
jgi:hypothetical protein